MQQPATLKLHLIAERSWLLTCCLFCLQLPAAALSLADVCHDPLLTTLGTSHLKPLLAASRQFREVVHSFIPSLTIGGNAATSSPYDIFLLAKGNWANLETLILKQPLQLGEVLDLTRGHLPLLASLEAHIQGRSTLPFSQLATGKWPLLRLLNLSNSHLTAAAMAKVKRGRWPALKQLVLHSCRLNFGAIAHLTETQWTNLELIDLHDNPMEAQDMANLTAGFWPSLTTLNAGTLLEQAAWGNLITGQPDYWAMAKSAKAGVHCGLASSGIYTGLVLTLWSARQLWALPVLAWLSMLEASLLVPTSVVC